VTSPPVSAPVREQMAPRYAEVAVQLPVHGTFCYQVPPRLADRELRGARVLVPFGNRGVAGVIVSVTDQPPAGMDTAPALARSPIRAIDALLEDEAPVPAELLELCLWIAAYYEAPPGEVLRAALPVGAQVSAQQILELTEAGQAALDAAADAGGAMSPRQRDILGALAQAGGALAQRVLLGAARKGGRGVRSQDLAALVESGLVRHRRVMDRARVQARTARTAVLARPITDEDRARLGRAPRQQAALAALEAAGGAAAVAALSREQPHAASHLRALAAAGLVRFELRELAPGASPDTAPGLQASSQPPVLTTGQQSALAAIRAALDQGEFAAFLLHGITGSGKTEVYLHAIAGVLAAGRTAVVLVPEISLTPQLAARFRARFGDQVAVLHSGLTDRERFDEWQRLRAGVARIALGARSAVFAPVERPAIIVVDEEHDTSFKQDEGVRYNARDVALVRAQRAGGVCLLGSATPSLESFYAAESGRYALLSLPERPTPRPLPEVELIDLRTYRAETEAMLTAPLSQAIGDTLARGEQVILFLNRRGFDTFVLCRGCGHAFRCEQCSVSLTYHRARDFLLCHYCGYHHRVPEVCPACSRTGTIVRKGLGTEKVAAAVAERFSGARVGRLDRDVATGPRIGEILGRMARRELDILVGTQMVTKGHDFPGVTLVGVLCADTGLSLPDFRASERTFQLLTQVAGRAGRGDQPGRVLIQSYRTDAVAVAAAAQHDYVGFYRAERTSRQELGYPPFGHLVALRVDGPDAPAVEQATRALADRALELCARLGVTVLGPAEAPLARLKGRTRWHMWLRASARKPLRALVRTILRGDAEPGGPPAFQPPAHVRVTVDVDPVSAL
jgi:primosomal protein N' (replication factor Y) (superfamily II helicase)